MPPSNVSDFSQEIRILTTLRTRQQSRLDDAAWPADLPEAGLEALAHLAGSARDDESIWLWGGEPCLRADLPTVIAACAKATSRPIGLRTDGLALCEAAALAPLRDAGLGALRITLHSNVPEAHDWLVRLPGAGRRAMRAIRSCVVGGLPVEVEATVTRPTTPHLQDLLLLCRRLGVSAVHLRRLTSRGAARAEFISLSPRMALVEPLLDEIGRQLDDRMTLTLEGFPRCAAGAAADHCRPRHAVRWSQEPLEIGWQEGCPACPGPPRCEGAPVDYVERFGAREFLSEDGGETSPQPLTPQNEEPLPSPPPPRLGRAPATRHRVVIAQQGLSLDGDPLAPRAPRRQCDRIRVEIGAESSSRAFRQQVVRAAQEGAAVLQVDARTGLRHPDFAALLHDCTILGFERVELHTDLRDLAERGDAEVYALRGVSLALTGLDRPEEIERVAPQLERMSRLSGAETGVVALISNPLEVDEFARAWAAGELPGLPHFRLVAGNGCLASLSAMLRDLPPASAAALEVQIPVCVRSPQSASAPCASLSGRCGSAGEHPDCPGIPEGWSLFE